VNFPLFPIGLPGFVNVRCRLRQTNPETDWVDIAEFPLLVVHLPQPDAEAVAPDKMQDSEETTPEP
jgi:hypothetical protein